MMKLQVGIVIALALGIAANGPFDRDARRQDLCPLFPDCDCVGEHTTPGKRRGKLVCKKHKISEKQCEKLHTKGNRKGRPFNTVYCGGFIAEQQAEAELSECNATKVELEERLEAAEARNAELQETLDATNSSLGVALADLYKCMYTPSPTLAPAWPTNPPTGQPTNTPTLEPTSSAPTTSLAPTTPKFQAQLETVACFQRTFANFSDYCTECCPQCLAVVGESGLESHFDYVPDTSRGSSAGDKVFWYPKDPNSCVCVVLAGDDYVHGDNGDVYLTEKSDCLYAWGFRNDFRGMEGDDVMYVGGSNVHVDGGFGNDVMHGDGTDIRFWDNPGDDHITLYGSGGLVRGGDGNDVCRFDDASVGWFSEDGGVGCEACYYLDGSPRACGTYRRKLTPQP